MEISVQNLTDLAICDQNGVAPPPPPPPATAVSDDKILVPGELSPLQPFLFKFRPRSFGSSSSRFETWRSCIVSHAELCLVLDGSVEVCLKPSSTARADDVRSAVER